MFQDYRPSLRLAYKQGIAQYTLFDDEFEEDICVSAKTSIGPTDILAIIGVYKKRNLPIGPNIVKALQHITSTYGYPMALCLKNCRALPEYAEHKETIEKYLTLL